MVVYIQIFNNSNLQYHYKVSVLIALHEHFFQHFQNAFNNYYQNIQIFDELSKNIFDLIYVNKNYF